MAWTKRKNRGKGHRGTKATGRDSSYARKQMSPAAKKRNAQQTKLRRDAIKAGRVSRGDGTHLAHKRAGSRGGSYKLKSGNIYVSKPKANQSKGNRSR